MDIQRHLYQRVYLTGIHNWVSSNSTTGKTFKQFLRQINEELCMPVSFDIRIMELVREQELQLKDQAKLRLLHQFVKELINHSFIPKQRGNQLLMTLTDLNQRLETFLANYKHIEWETILSERVPTFCSKLIRYKVVNRSINNFWEIVRKHESIDEALRITMQHHLQETEPLLEELLISIGKSNAIDTSPRSDQIIEVVDYFRGLFDRFEETYQIKLQIELFGSCVNGFGLANSDLDMNVVAVGMSLDDEPELFQLFRKVTSFLRKNLGSGYEIVQEVWKNFRLLEITKKYGNEELDIDVLVGRKHGQRNTEMQRSYSQLDPKIRWMGILLKLWGKHVGFIVKFKMTSYAVIMMMLHYLQRRGIIGNLKVGADGNSFDVGKIYKKNFSLLKELKGFFNFYKLKGEFFKKGGRPKISLDPAQINNFTGKGSSGLLFDIVDPFELNKNLGKVPVHEQDIMNSYFQQALANLLSGDSNTITSMFSPELPSKPFMNL